MSERAGPVIAAAAVLLTIAVPLGMALGENSIVGVISIVVGYIVLAIIGLFILRET